MPYTPIKDRLDHGDLVVLDGGTGTELERRGVPMDANAWCGAASMDHLDTLVEVHCSYIDAGAEVITANTYASSKLMLRPAGLGDKFEDLNRSAIEAAHKACRLKGRSDIAVAGSLSHMIPITKGSDTSDATRAPSMAEIEDALNKMAELHKSEGCDLIILEMLYHPARSALAIRAANSVGLPVWAGFSARRSKSGQLVSYQADEDVPFADLVALLKEHDVQAAGTMHTPSNLIEEATNTIKSVFSGSLMAYPDSGHFKMPHWQFENVIPPAELKSYAATWFENGVHIIGGCCGLSPDHIVAVAELRA